MKNNFKLEYIVPRGTDCNYMKFKVTKPQMKLFKQNKSTRLPRVLPEDVALANIS